MCSRVVVLLVTARFFYLLILLFGRLVVFVSFPCSSRSPITLDYSYAGKGDPRTRRVGKGRKDHEIVQEEAEEKSREEKEAC